jgi:hypothetical protein
MRFLVRVPYHRLGAITKLELDLFDAISHEWDMQVPKSLLNGCDQSYNPTDWTIMCTHILPRMQALVELRLRFDRHWFVGADERRDESEKAWMPQLLEAVSGLERLKVFEIWLDKEKERFREAWEDKDARLVIEVARWSRGKRRISRPL